MPTTSTLPEITSLWLQASLGVFNEDSLANYRALLENHALPYFGDRTDISKAEVMAFREAKIDSGLSESVTFTLCRLLERILGYGAGHGLCAAPGWNLSLPTPQRKRETVILSTQEEQRLLAYLTSEPTPMHLCLFLMLTTGVSVGEVLSVRWKDVSVKNGSLRVYSSRGPMNARRSRTRTVSFGERQRIYLRRMEGGDECYLCSGEPRPRQRAALQIRWHKVCDHLMLPDMSPTELRHTFAVRCIESGMDYDSLASALGVENSQHFRATYRSLVGEDQKQRLERERFEGRKVRTAPRHLEKGPRDPEATPYRLKLDRRRAELRQELEALEGDLAIIRYLRYSDGLQGAHREAFYDFVERVLPEDKDACFAVNYLRANMRIADMSLLQEASPNAIRRRVTRGFQKISSRLGEIYAVEGYNILGMFRDLCARIIEAAPPAPTKSGPKPKPGLSTDYRKALEAIERIAQALQKL